MTLSINLKTRKQLRQAYEEEIAHLQSELELARSERDAIERLYQSLKRTKRGT